MTRRTLPGYARRFHPAVLALILAAALIPVLLTVVQGGAPAAPPAQSDMPAACLTDNPFFATSCYVRGDTFDGEPAVVAFHDSPDDTEHYVLATVGEVGATYGQAYDPAVDSLYTAAFHKRNSKFGPLGPGGIYRIDVNGGGVEALLTVPNAGRDRHDPDNNYQPDDAGRNYAGKTSLGDIDMNEDGSELFVMNLNDQKIYRYSLPDGRLIGSFASGGVGENWNRDARPFALKVSDGWVFHGVVNSSERRQSLPNLWAYVYASKPDGTAMRRVAGVWMGYDRGPRHPEWNPWPEEDDINWRRRTFPHPMLTDIEFDDAGNMILGIRDRWIDTGPSLTEVYRTAPGDLLLARKTGDLTWELDYDEPEHYSGDGLDPYHDEIAIGGLARVITKDVVVSTVIDPFRTLLNRSGQDIGSISAGAAWFDNVDGTDLGREELIYNEGRHSGPQGKALGMGDLEIICYIPPTPTPTLTASPTPEVSPTPTVTDTPIPPTFTIYLPVVDRGELCIPDAFHTDVVLVLDRSTSMLRSVEDGGLPKNEAAIEAAMRFVGQLDFTPDVVGRHDQVSVVGFNDTAWIEEDLTSDRDVAMAALERIRTKTVEGTRLDLAFLEGQKPLDGPNRMPANRPVLILLTDGLPNRVPFEPPLRQEDTVLAAAQLAKDAGTRVYTIGVGRPTDINPRLLFTASSEKWMYYYAPRSEDLAGIYAQIAQTFDECKPRPAPTPSRCVAEENHIDVVVVLDMSTSMNRLTSAGRPKAEAALEAAQGFVDLLDLERDGWGRQDQVAIVGFNDTAWIEIGLSEDRAAVGRAIQRLPAKMAEGTRLDMAFRRGQDALEAGPLLPENRPTMIMLTDGLPNRVPFPPGGRQEDTVLAEAARAKDRDTQVFTIGLGRPEDILGWLLEECATEPEMYYYAPDGEDLADIYTQIAGRVSECREEP